MDKRSKSLEKLVENSEAFSAQTGSPASKDSKDSANSFNSGRKPVELERLAYLLDRLHHGIPGYSSPLSD